MNRYATWVAAGALVLVAAGLATGCARSRSVLYSGVGGRAVPDAKALRDVRAVHVQWISEIHRRAREDSGERFANLPARQLRVRLSEAAARYGFTVTKFQLLHPKQLAPVIIIQTRRYLAFARAVAAIEDSLDPTRGTATKGDGPTRLSSSKHRTSAACPSSASSTSCVAQSQVVVSGRAAIGCTRSSTADSGPDQCPLA